MEKEWRNYEKAAVEIIGQLARELGLSHAQLDEKLVGASGAEWKIEGRGVRAEDGATIIIECKRYTTKKLEQELLAGLAFRIQDTGSAGGIVVSPLGLQEGALKVAAHTNIISIEMDKDATIENFVLKFLNKIMIRATEHLGIGDEAIITVRRACKSCGRQFETRGDEKLCPDCAPQ